jgi:hypothetical protein
VAIGLIWFKSTLDITKHYEARNPFYFGEYIVNYSGGFVRRGLLGSIFGFIGNTFNIAIGKIVYTYQLIVVTAIALGVSYFAKITPHRWVFFLFILSPLGYAFPLFDTFVAGRKEEILLAVAVFASFCFRRLGFGAVFWLYIGLTTCLALIHEVAGLGMLLILPALTRGVVQRNLLVGVLFFYTIILFATLTTVFSQIPNERIFCDVLSTQYMQDCGSWKFSVNYLKEYGGLKENIVRSLPFITSDGMLLHIIIIAVYYLSIFAFMRAFVGYSDSISIFLICTSPFLLLLLVGDYGRWMRLLFFIQILYMILTAGGLSCGRENVTKGCPRGSSTMSYFIYMIPTFTLFFSIEHANFPVVHGGYPELFLKAVRKL